MLQSHLLQKNEANRKNSMSSIARWAVPAQPNLAERSQRKRLDVLNLEIGRCLRKQIRQNEAN